MLWLSALSPEHFLECSHWMSSSGWEAKDTEVVVACTNQHGLGIWPKFQGHDTLLTHVRERMDH